MVAIIGRYPLPSFFVMAYGFSWGGYLLLSGPAIFPFGPCAAALVMAGITVGSAGLRELAGRALHWRVELRCTCWLCSYR